MGECRQQKHIQHAPSMKTECDYLSGGFKNGHIHNDLTQNGEPQRYSCGTQKKKRKKPAYFKMNDGFSKLAIFLQCLFKKLVHI